MAGIQTWAGVKPKLEAELEGVKAALLTCSGADLVRLQERANALIRLKGWFEDQGTDPNRNLTSDEIEY